jgi:hypothetical protein
MEESSFHLSIHIGHNTSCRRCIIPNLKCNTINFKREKGRNVIFQSTWLRSQTVISKVEKAFKAMVKKTY